MAISHDIVRDVLSHSSPPVTAVTAAIEVVTGTSTFRVRCTSTGGRALNMDVSGPNGYSSDISSDIQPVGTRMYLGSDSYTATTEVMSNGMAGDVYQCNVTSVASRTGSVTVEGKSLFVGFISWISPLLQLLLQPSAHWSKQLLILSQWSGLHHQNSHHQKSLDIEFTIVSLVELGLRLSPQPLPVETSLVSLMEGPMSSQ